MLRAKDVVSFELETQHLNLECATGEGIGIRLGHRQRLARILRGDFPSLQPIQDLSARRSGIGFDELQTVCNPREPRFDGRVTDSEYLLHLFNGPVRADEGCDEDLIFQAQPGQLGQLKAPLQDDVFL